MLVLGVDQLSAIFLEARKRAGLVRTHQPAIPGNIGGQYGGELALDLVRSHPGFPPAGYPLRITAVNRNNITSTHLWLESSTVVALLRRKPAIEQPRIKRFGRLSKTLALVAKPSRAQSTLVKIWQPNARFGSKADLGWRPHKVRFTSNNGPR